MTFFLTLFSKKMHMNIMSLLLNLLKIYEVLEYFFAENMWVSDPVILLLAIMQNTLCV